MWQSTEEWEFPWFEVIVCCFIAFFFFCVGLSAMNVSWTEKVIKAGVAEWTIDKVKGVTINEDFC